MGEMEPNKFDGSMQNLGMALEPILKDIHRGNESLYNALWKLSPDVQSKIKVLAEIINVIETNRIEHR